MEIFVLENRSDRHAHAIQELADSLDAIATARSWRPGGILFEQGQPADGVFVVRQGSVRLSACGPGNEINLCYRVAGAGYVLGLPALFSGEAYSLTAQAVEECECGFVERELALTLVRKRADLCLEAANLLACEVKDLREWQAGHMSNQAVDGR
jgi:CRP/FNR family transcriptional regulator, cyclic AMP receptor protein